MSKNQSIGEKIKNQTLMDGQPLELPDEHAPGAGQTPALLPPSPPGTPRHCLKLSLDPRHQILGHERYSGGLPCGGVQGERKIGMRTFLRACWVGALWKPPPSSPPTPPTFPSPPREWSTELRGQHRISTGLRQWKRYR